MPLDALRTALLNSAPSITLNADFMGPDAPEGLDAALAAAFPKQAVHGVALTYTQGDVGQVDGDSLSVTNAQLSFIGYDAAKSDVTVTFTQDSGAVQVTIAVALSGWTFPTTFTQMTGWPFEDASFADPTFVFTTTEQEKFPWHGHQVHVAPGQNFVGTLTVPPLFDATLQLVGAGSNPGDVTAAGPIVVNKVTEVAGATEPNDPSEVVLYPDMDLRAQLGTQSVSLFDIFKAKAPAVGLLVEGATVTTEIKPPKTVYDQAPALYFAAELDVGPVALDLRTQLASEGRDFGFGLMVRADSPAILTPANAIKLLTGDKFSATFLDSVPAPLQQFLSWLELQGVSATGQLPPNSSLTSLGMSIGSKAGKPLHLFSDPTASQAFQIDSVELSWVVLDPLGTPTNLVTIGATFVLWKAVFPGLWYVSIDQDMRVDGGYDGSVSLSDLLGGVTGGAIKLPPSVDVRFSDIAIAIDPTARSYSLACTTDVALDFLEIGGYKLLSIEGLRTVIGASTPTTGDGKTGKTVYSGQMAGYIAVGPLAANVSVAYDGAAEKPGWQLSADLARPIELSHLLEHFFNEGKPYNYPDFLPHDVTIAAFGMTAAIPSGTSPPPASYTVGGTLTWKIPALSDQPASAAVAIQYDGSRTGSKYSGSVVGKLPIKRVNTVLEVGYQFGTEQVLWIAWSGIRGEWVYDKGPPLKNQVKLRFSDCSVGSIITSLVKLVDPDFELTTPWDFLNKVSLDGLELMIDFDPAATVQFSASYPVSIDLGFIKINRVYLNRSRDGSVTLAVDGDSLVPQIKDSHLMKPATGGQSVKDLPSGGGQGTEYFKLNLLVLGQRIAIEGASSFKDVKDAITKIEGAAKDTKGGTNPVDPTPTPGALYYDPSRNWLVAAHFGVLKVGTVYTFELMVVFDDPDLYGLRLAFNGDKAKILDGLSIDVLYKKVTDDVGMYQVEFTFPKILRTFDVGMFTITLPTIGVQIYTNGDFLFDFGFPYNLDFSRSFTLQAVIPPGVPILGSAGFYFGRLSVGAAAQLPQNAQGTFSPAIVFGIGIQAGVGKYFQAGPLSAGFSITVFGIVEGIIAAWHPPTSAGELEAGAGPLAVSGAGGALQGDYFFRLQGSFGLIGKLYGSVDFGIVKADINLTVTLAARITVEAFKDIQLSASASVSISVTIRINLGLFTIRISFSFAATVRADLTIQTGDHSPPWYAHRSLETANGRPHAAIEGPRQAPAPKPLTAANGKAALNLYLSPQFSVLAPDASAPTQQQGAFVLLLATDAPTADGSGNRGASSFESLCEALLPWLVDALTTGEGETADLEAASQTAVTKKQLEDFVQTLHSAPISESDIEQKFLAPGFDVSIQVASLADQKKLQAGSTLFPAFGGLTIGYPDPGGSGTKSIALSGYTQVTPGYRDALTTLFAKLAAKIQQETGGQQVAADVPEDGPPEALAEFVFEDWFAIVGEQLLQLAADAIGDYAYALQPGDSIEKIASWANARGNSVGPVDVATPNLTHALQGGKPLSLTGIHYAVQAGDSLTSVAQRYTDANGAWKTTEAELILTGQGVQGLVAPGAAINLPGANPYVTQLGDSFATVAAAVGKDADWLSQQTALYGRKDLLAPAAPMPIPTIAYVTAADGSDTLQAIVARFGLPLTAILAVDANLNVGDLFATTGPIRIANLLKLFVSDLWAAIQLTDHVAQVAGMVARFQLHGLRLPVMTGLELPGNFAYPSDQTDYGLYQLTGQQFPVGTLSATPSYSIELSKDTTLAFVDLVGGPTLSVDLSPQARELYYVLNYAQANLFDPKPALFAQPEVEVRPKRYAAQAATPWQTSDLQHLADVTAPPARSGIEDGSTPSATPLLWDLPPALLQRAADRQAVLDRVFGRKAALPYLPVLQPQVGTTDPASGHTTFTAVERFAYATKVQFEVKRLAQTDDLPPEGPLSNTVLPPSEGNAGGPTPLAPFNYELVGPGPADALLLERILATVGVDGNDDMISGAFLLWEGGSPGAPGLTSQAPAEFLAFATQTNLSTETAPPTSRAALMLADPTLPRGLAQSATDFVKLLWEVSTVRAGGYYLYFQQPSAGVGLPDSLFDSSGAATLTLVLTFDRGDEPEGAGRVTDFVNALVTTESVDTSRAVMTFDSWSSQAKSAALTGTETLAEVADLYGADVGALAADNPTAQFTNGSKIPISGVVHQVNSADLASGNAMATIAAYYSRGAQTPITAAALAAFNPGIAGALGDALRIPPIVCLAGASGGVGNSFADLNRAYGLSFDALGYAARDVVGLFSVSATLTVDSQERSATPSLGNGNEGVQLTRPPLPDIADLPPTTPTPQQADDFASAYLLALYTMLTGATRATPFFTPASPQGLPFGPRQPVSPDEAHAHRDPQVRQLALVAQAAESLLYEQTIGFGDFAQINPGPDPDPKFPGLPPKCANPYVGVGSVLQIDLRWVDVFGNQIASAFSAPPANYPGPLNGLPIAVDYSDRLIGLSSWPNVKAEYTYSGAPGPPQLDVTLTLQPAAYEPPQEPDHALNATALTGVPVWQQNAINDLKTYIQLYFQLNQNYDSVTVSGLSGQAVSMSLTDTVLADPELPLSPSQEKQVRDFVAGCVSYLAARADARGATPPDPALLSTSLSIADVATLDVIPLTVSFTLRRQADLCDPSLRAVGALSDTTPIPAASTTMSDGTVSLSAFAAALEGVFVTGDWQMRVATAPGSGGESVWAVRMGKAAGQGIWYDVDPGASFYAPRPVASALRDGDAKIDTYASGKEFPATTETLSFKGVDLNAWAQQAFASVDWVLSATYAAPAYVVDRLDPDKNDYLGKLLKHKDTLAAAIARSVEPILDTSATDKPTRQAAEDKLYQALLDELGNATTLTAVVVLPVSNAVYSDPLPPDAVPPRLYGQPLGATTESDQYSLSTGKVPLTRSDGDGVSRLAFLFSSKNVTEDAYVPLRLGYAVSHLEHHITDVPGIKGYEQSDWLLFVNGPFDKPDPATAPVTNVPVVLRALPQPPSMTAQTATEAHPVNPDTTPGELAQWDYGFSYVYRGAAQDTVTATVEFNRGAGLLAQPSDSLHLFTALAQFVTAQSAIEADLEAYLRPVDGTRGNDQGVADARWALAAFEAVTKAVAHAYDAWSRAASFGASGAMPARETYVYEIALHRDGDNARVDIAAADAKAPQPAVAIDGWNAAAANPGPGDRWAYEYWSGDPDQKTWLLYEQALDIGARTVAFDDLNVFGRQDGYASTKVVRNLDIVPDAKTRATFQFSTPEVRFADRVVPLLVYPEYALGPLVKGHASLASYLEAFFVPLLAGADDLTVAVKLASGYEYSLAPTIGELPPTVLPINLLPPTPYTPNGNGSTPAFVTAVADAVDDWLGHLPVDAPGARVTFRVEVFAGSGNAPLPLLSVADLYVDASALTH